jgi:hypothetical protein
MTSQSFDVEFLNLTSDFENKKEVEEGEEEEDEEGEDTVGPDPLQAETFSSDEEFDKNDVRFGSEGEIVPKSILSKPSTSGTPKKRSTPVKTPKAPKVKSVNCANL